MQLLTQLAALPAEQRTALARLLTPASNSAPILDDQAPPGYERDDTPALAHEAE